MKVSFRGQASIEFMTILGIVLLIFVMLGLMVYGNYVKGNDLKIYIYGQRLANHIADHINTMNTVADGHSSAFWVPDYLWGSRMYNINFFKNESSIFVKGSTFTSGREIIYSSPITTNNLHCVLSQCTDRCNLTSDQYCVEVNSSIKIRLTKYIGAIYMTQTHNAIQGNVKEYITPYEGDGDVDPDDIPEFVGDVTDINNRWNIIYVWRNRNDNSLTLAVSMNLTGSDRAMMHIEETLGEVVSFAVNDALPAPEMDPAGTPTFDFKQAGPWDVDGAAIKYAGGFRTCIDPYNLYMPSQDWVLMSSDGNHLTLNKAEVVCIAYP